MHLASYIALSALATFAGAQTYSKCNPTEVDCPNDPAMAATLSTDFKAGAGEVKGWKQTSGSLTYSPEGAQFTINKQGDNPTIQSETYLFFGRVEVKAKAAAGKGIISSIILQSEDLDEVDWEFIGTVPNTVQTNYFGKGNTTTYDRMIEAPVSNVQTEMHTYTLDWTTEAITFIIDGKPVRTLKYGDANGGKNYPQTPSTVRIGIWAGGDPTNHPDTIKWAGGESDFTKVPFTMTVESVKITNYSPGKEYKWTDKTGSWQSIEVIGKGDTNGAPQNSVVLPPSASGTGGGLQSQIDVPPATKPSTTCAVSTSTVIVTGPSPPPAKPTSGVTTEDSSPGSIPPTSGVTTEDSSPGSVPPPATPTSGVTTEDSSPGSVPPTPATTAPASSPPPYPTTGIIVDTNPPPTVPFPTGGSPSIPINNTEPEPSQFPGAASTNKAGALALVVAAAAMLLV